MAECLAGGNVDVNWVNLKEVNFILTPNLMFRFAPGHMRDLSADSVSLKYTNLYALNKTSSVDVIEKGFSTILGLDYSFDIKNQNNSKERKLSASLGQVFNIENVADMPAKSSLDQKTSDIVGEINYNFSELSNIEYKFSLDHDLNTLNYNEISTNLNFGIVISPYLNTKLSTDSNKSLLLKSSMNELRLIVFDGKKINIEV